MASIFPGVHSELRKLPVEYFVRKDVYFLTHTCTHHQNAKGLRTAHRITEPAQDAAILTSHL